MSDNRTNMTRRRMLTGLAVGSTGVSFGSLPGSVAASETGEIVTLGDFESGLDGWRTNGGNRLERVSASAETPLISEGSSALQVTVDGDPHPMIENVERVKRANFVDHPYLFVDAIPGAVSETDSDVTFVFRFHHGPTTDTGTGGGNASSTERGDSSGEKPVNVVESPEMTVPTHVTTSLTWDMSAVDDEKLADPRRLEITWFPSEHPSSRGARGRGPGFDYETRVLFDHVRLSDSQSMASVRGIQQQMRWLKRNHGHIVTTEVESMTDTEERGVFVFADDTEIPYTFVVTQSGPDRYVIDGTEYTLGGDQQ